MSFWKSAGSWLANNFLGLAGLGLNIGQNAQANKWNQKQLDAQIEENQKNRDFNHAEAELSRNFQADFAREMFDKTNQYNSVSNQVSQMKQSGLNPALMYGASNFAPSAAPAAPSASGSSSGSVSPTQYHQLDYQQQLLNIERQRAEIDNIKADTRGKDANADILESDASFRDAWNSKELILKGVTIDLGESQIDLNDAQNSNLRKQTELLQNQVNNFQLTVDLLKKQIQSIDIDNFGKIIDNFYKSPQYEAIIDNLSSSAKLSRAQAHSCLKLLYPTIKNLSSSTASNYSMSNYFDALGLNVETQGEILKFDMKRASNYRNAVDSLGLFGAGIEAARDFIAGLFSLSYGVNISPQK